MALDVDDVSGFESFNMEEGVPSVGGYGNGFDFEGFFVDFWAAVFSGWDVFVLLNCEVGG